MVELGDRQYPENVAFAAAARAVATDVVIVGFTNRRALLEGAGEQNVRISGWRAGAGGYTVAPDEDDDEEDGDGEARETKAGGNPPEGEAAPGEHALQVVVVGSRGEAVSWVKAHLGEGDVVLYENDLPDHFA
jgi:UDP-N-acetylmuramoyl-tripeptide--D-alanyl-D-alanine ligase